MFSVEEITKAVEETGLEIEVFAFGSVSPMSEGRCFLSSYMTGLSPTSEGACAPASHVTYKEDGDHVLSCLGDVVLNRVSKSEPAAYSTPCKARYVTRGTASTCSKSHRAQCDRHSGRTEKGWWTALKIEGRQRSRAYVSEVVSAFRKAVDALAEGESKTANDLNGLAEGKRQTTGAYKKGWR